MARGYTVVTTALALDTSVKWVDNVLSHFEVAGVSQTRQGVARKISGEAVTNLALVNRLAETLRIPLEIALDVATQIDRTGTLNLGLGVSFVLDRDAAHQEIEARLARAVEAAPLPRRGRPPGKAKRGA